MGMNIYTVKGNVHIGKRWAAGWWCWDCRIKAEVDHLGKFAFCPNCAKRCSFRTASFNPAMRELGFDKSDPTQHHGVDGASGFIWQVGEYGLGATREEVKQALKGRTSVKTEYGEKWPIKKFWAMFNDIMPEDDSDSDFS